MATFLLTLFIVICILLIVVVLLQKGRGGGIGGAFGGGMTSSAFGTKTGDVFTWVTIVLTSLFLLLAIVNTVAFREKEALPYTVFNPPKGPIEKETPVTITVQGALAKEVKVYYTLDNSEPTDKSEPYMQSAVKVKPGQTLRARAYRGDRPGPPTTVTYEYPKPATVPATPGAESMPAPESPSSASAPAGTSSHSSPAPAPASAPAATPHAAASGHAPAPVSTSAPASSPATP